jgi:hypothetical protein
VEPKFVGKSVIYEASFRETCGYWVDGTSPNSCMTTTTDIGFSIVHSAAVTGDLPLLRCMGRYNAKFDALSSGESPCTPLSICVSVIQMMSKMPSPPPAGACGGHPSEGARWLISRGVDVNIPDHRNVPPLLTAISTRPVDVDLCKLLLLHGADSSFLSQCPDRTIRNSLTKYAKSVKGSKNIPEPLCPCGNNVPVSTCHGAERGVPLHPRQFCLCKSGKTYRKCCFKRRYFWRESVKMAIPPPKIITDKRCMNVISKYQKLQSADARANGMTDEEIGKMKMFPGMTVEGAVRIQHETTRHLIETSEEQIDPCFAWCTQHKDNDFIYARSWRQNGIMRIDKTEGLLRRDQWNSWVDEYIETHPSDRRSRREIEVLSKISWNGCALYKTCGGPACGSVEETDGQFKHCARCGVACCK